MHGSAALLQTLLEEDLIDELRLVVFPWCWDGGSGPSGTERSHAR
ncbi:MAG: dihydrofolate reductase family protein [Actinomycetota bacterium]|nr:dihydrofolate reductase family protein [Actinomycetota bacterium]